MPDNQSTERRYLIWWTLNYQAEQTVLPVGCPFYIREQLRDRRGRNGRGRLWVAPEIPLENMDRPDAALHGMGGIVIYSHHLSVVRGLPGVVTDLNGERL